MNRKFSFYRNNYQNIDIDVNNQILIVSSTSDTTKNNRSIVEFTSSGIQSLYVIEEINTIINTTVVNTYGTTITITNHTTVSAYNFTTSSTTTTTFGDPNNPIIFEFIEIVDQRQPRYCNLPYGLTTENQCIDYYIYLLSAVPLRGLPLIIIFAIFFVFFSPFTCFMCDCIRKDNRSFPFIEKCRRNSLEKKMLIYMFPQLLLLAGMVLIGVPTFVYAEQNLQGEIKPFLNNAINTFFSVEKELSNFTFTSQSNYTYANTITIMLDGVKSTSEYLNQVNFNVDLGSLMIEWVYNIGKSHFSFFYFFSPFLFNNTLIDFLIIIILFILIVYMAKIIIILTLLVIGLLILVLTTVSTLFIYGYIRLFGVVFATTFFLYMLCVFSLITTEILRQITDDYCYEVRYRYSFVFRFQ
jgi:hypothetical protein